MFVYIIQDLRPSFTRISNGKLRLNYSEEAKRFKDSKSTKEIVYSSLFQCKDEREVKRAAVESVQARGGNTKGYSI